MLSGLVWYQSFGGEGGNLRGWGSYQFFFFFFWFLADLLGSTKSRYLSVQVFEELCVCV